MASSLLVACSLQDFDSLNKGSSAGRKSGGGTAGRVGGSAGVGSVERGGSDTGGIAGNPSGNGGGTAAGNPGVAGRAIGTGGSGGVAGSIGGTAGAATTKGGAPSTGGKSSTTTGGATNIGGTTSTTTGGATNIGGTTSTAAGASGITNTAGTAGTAGVGDGATAGMAGAAGSGNKQLLVNPGFELSYSGWTFDPLSVRGTYVFTQWPTTGSVTVEGQYELSTWTQTVPFTVKVTQVVTGLADGKYTFQGWFNRGDGFNFAYILATGCGGANRQVNIPLTAPTQWLDIQLSGIDVVGGRCEVGFYVDSNAGNWLNADAFSFTRDPL